MDRLLQYQTALFRPWIQNAGQGIFDSEENSGVIKKQNTLSQSR